MPAYDFMCQKCKRTDELIYRMQDKPKSVKCNCGGDMISIPARINIQAIEPTWLNDEVRGSLQTEKEAKENPITNRDEYNKYLKDNDLVAVS